MGNVHAYSAAPPPPPPPTSTSFPKGKECDNKAAKPLESTVENPGPLEEIHTKCKSMYSVITS